VLIALRTPILYDEVEITLIMRVISTFLFCKNPVTDVYKREWLFPTKHKIRINWFIVENMP